VEHPQEVLGESLVADDEPPKILEPVKESLDLPPALAATQRATILGSLRPRPPAHAGPSLRGWREAPVDERLLQIQIAFVAKGLRKDFEDSPQQAGADPVLESPVAIQTGWLPREPPSQMGPASGYRC
jgi:hypothetical protein